MLAKGDQMTVGTLAESRMARPKVGDDNLVATRAASLAQDRAEREARVLVVAPEGGQQRGSVVKQAGDVDPGERGRHQPECRQSAVAAAHVWVGQEHAVAGRSRCLF